MTTDFQPDKWTGLEETPDYFRKEMFALEWRDLQLWAITALLLLVVGAGVVALTMPQLLWNFGENVAGRHNLPQLAVGLITLLVLLNAYTLHQKIRLQRVRKDLFDQLQKLQSISQMDPLTSAFNRRAMDEILRREVSRAQRTDARVCIMVVDVDDFKKFNTRFGHVVGDRVLVDVARILKKNFRASDSVIRYGGDEFVVILSDTSISRAKIAEDRLHRLVAKWNYDNRNRGYQIALSSGLAQYEPGQSADELIHAADQAMFAHKHGLNINVSEGAMPQS